MTGPEQTAGANRPLGIGRAAAAARFEQVFGGVPGLDVKRGLAYMQNDCAFYEQMLRKFVASHRRDAEALREQIQSGCLTDAIQMVHSLKGVSGMLGAADLQSLAGETEQLLRASAPRPTLTTAVEKLGTALAALVEALEARF